MLKKLLSLLPVALLVSCATTAISPDYRGPTATIQETAIRVDSGKAQMFFLSEIDGKYISDNSSSRSFSESYGKGNNLTIIDSPYKVPAQSHVFTIVGSHVWAMDGRALFEADLRVSGEVTFSPIEGKIYLINGVLGKEESTVWIKDSETGDTIAEFKKQIP